MYQYSRNYYPQYQDNGLNWVQGETGAKSYAVAPGASVLLMDYVRGHYSRNDGNDYSESSYKKYMDSKRSYRMSHSSGNRQAVMDNLHAYMEDLTDRLEELKRDADNADERNTIDLYIGKIKSI